MSTFLSAKVKGGVIVVADDIVLPEGATVAVVLDDGPSKDDDDQVTPIQLAELDACIAEADRGELTPWETVRSQLFGRR